MNNKKAYISIIFALALIGTVGLLRRFIPLSSALLAFFRGIIGAVFLGLFAICFKKNTFKKIKKKQFLLTLLGGAIIGINWMLLFEAYNHTTVATATLCYYLAPTIVILVSPIFFKERLTCKMLICAFVALIGMVLVSGIIGQNSSPDLIGVLFGTGAAFLYSAAIIINKKISDIDVYQRTTLQLLSAAIILLPYILIESNFANPFNSLLELTAKEIVLVLIMGIIYTGVFYAMYFGSMDKLKAQTVSVLSYTDPIVAMLVSILVLKEQLSPLCLVGGVLILGAAFVSEFNFSGKKGR